VNKDLYGKVYKIPDNILSALKPYSQNETIRNILNKGEISYSLVKKCIHRMENHEKDILGGDQFYGWLRQTLNSDRGSIQQTKQNKSNVGLPNAFIRPHEKNKNVNNVNRPSKEHTKLSSELKINEHLKRINELISKII
jgi:hypothetical protein